MTKILIDMNNVGWIAQQSGMKLSNGATNTTGVYGFLRILRNIAEQFHGDLILLDDGRSWRYEVYPEYKGNRKANPVILKGKEDWKASKEILKPILSLMNASYIIADNMEADDMAAKLSRKLVAAGEDVLLVSGDGDWKQLISDKVRIYDPKNDLIVALHNFEEQVGLPTPKALIEMKSISGDAGDNIKSIGGVGPVTAKLIIDAWSSYANFYTMTRHMDKFEIEALNPKLRKLVLNNEKMQNYRKNRLLVDLSHHAIPEAKNIKFIPGKLDEERLKDIFAEHGFVSFLREFDGWIVPFKNRKNK